MNTTTAANTLFEDAGVEKLLDQFRLSEAAELALSGNTAPAKVLLEELIQRPDASVAALDLMARVCVQQGSFGEAGEFWRRALAKEPNNRACQAAAARLHRIQRRPLWFIVLWPIIVASLLLTALLWGWHVQYQHNRSEFARLESLIGSGSPSPSDLLPGMQSLPQPDIHVPGVVVRPLGERWMVCFGDGLFDRGNHFRPGGTEQLTAVVQTLARSGEHYSLEVIGYSDGAPGLVAHADYIIGLKRAEAVAQLIGSSALFPTNRVRISSGNSEDPPFVGNSKQVREQNRTVVLVVSRKEE